MPLASEGGQPAFCKESKADDGLKRKPISYIEQDMLDVKLVVVGGATEGDEFRLELPVVLGRAREASLPLPHPLVSRHHCELFDRNGALVVRDLGSTNGTFVGSERVTEAVLAHGQLLTIGTVTLRAFYSGRCTPVVSAVPTEAQIGGADFPATDETVDQETTTIQTMADIAAMTPHERVSQRAK